MLGSRLPSFHILGEAILSLFVPTLSAAVIITWELQQKFIDLEVRT